LSSIKYPNLPSALRPFLTSPDAHDTYRKSQSYARHKLSFSSVTSILSLLQTFILLTSLSTPLFEKFGFNPPNQSNWTLLKGFWDAAAKVPGVGKSELRQTAAFIAGMNLVGTVIGIPEGLYKNFVLEEKHGFNKMTYKTFVQDLFKGESDRSSPQSPSQELSCSETISVHRSRTIFRTRDPTLYRTSRTHSLGRKRRDPSFTSLHSLLRVRTRTPNGSSRTLRNHAPLQHLHLTPYYLSSLP